MHIRPNDVEKSVVEPDNPPRQLQRKRGSVSGSRQPEDQQYYHEVVEALAGAQEVLIVGPGHAKLGLIKHIHDHQVVGSDKAPERGLLFFAARRVGFS
jgi:stalled ribosome rescue protein Dom34